MSTLLGPLRGRLDKLRPLIYALLAYVPEVYRLRLGRGLITMLDVHAAPSSWPGTENRKSALLCGGQ